MSARRRVGFHVRCILLIEGQHENPCILASTMAFPIGIDEARRVSSCLTPVLCVRYVPKVNRGLCAFEVC